MSDRDDQKNGDLILSGNRSLAIKRLDLVKRGLELSQGLKKRQLSVMVVDDDEGTVELLESYITFHFSHFHIEKAYDGQEAVMKIRKNIPDLLITGIMMPRMDGVQLLKHLHNENLDVPTIIISGTMYLLNYVLDMKTSGVTNIAAFFGKPFDVKDLILAIKGITERSNQDAPIGYRALPVRSSK